MICKCCKLDKKKEPVSRGTHTRFVDENNKMWNGKQCGECYRVYNRERMRLKRLNEKNHKSDIQET